MPRSIWPWPDAMSEQTALVGKEIEQPKNAVLGGCQHGIDLLMARRTACPASFVVEYPAVESPSVRVMFGAMSQSGCALGHDTT